MSEIWRGGYKFRICNFTSYDLRIDVSSIERGRFVLEADGDFFGYCEPIDSHLVIYQESKDPLSIGLLVKDNSPGLRATCYRRDWIENSWFDPDTGCVVFFDLGGPDLELAAEKALRQIEEKQYG